MNAAPDLSLERVRWIGFEMRHFCPDHATYRGTVSSAPMTQLGTQPDKILVVDDEELLRALACDLLEDAGFSVIEAANSEQALQILNEQPDVGLLFTDVQMAPGIDGMELARQVHDQWPNILLLVTSGGRAIVERDIPDAGRFQQKPYGMDMVTKVKGLFEAKHRGSSH